MFGPAARQQHPSVVLLSFYHSLLPVFPPTLRPSAPGGDGARGWGDGGGGNFLLLRLAQTLDRALMGP